MSVLLSWTKERVGKVYISQNYFYIRFAVDLRIHKTSMTLSCKIFFIKSDTFQCHILLLLSSSLFTCISNANSYFWTRQVIHNKYFYLGEKVKGTFHEFNVKERTSLSLLPQLFHAFSTDIALILKLLLISTLAWFRYFYYHTADTYSEHRHIITRDGGEGMINQPPMIFMLMF